MIGNGILFRYFPTVYVNRRSYVKQLERWSDQLRNIELPVRPRSATQCRRADSSELFLAHVDRTRRASGLPVEFGSPTRTPLVRLSFQIL